MSLWEWLYKLFEIFIEIEIDDYIKTWKRTDEQIWKYIEKNRKEQILERKKIFK